MGSRLASRRAAKAARRKKILAARRAAERVDTHPPLRHRLLRAAAGPIEACLMQEGLFDRGNGAIVLLRKSGIGELAMAAFLVDTFCLGVKSVHLAVDDTDEIEASVEFLEAGAPFAPIEPAYARKLLRDLVAWSRALGFAPPVEYTEAERFFGDISPDNSDAVFSFGRNGKPLYVPGPEDTRRDVRLALETLRRHVGEGGFGFAVPDEDGESALAYDPDEPPDPEAWLAHDEYERVALAAAYHERLEPEMSELKTHATIHAAIESQIAEGARPVIDAVGRLMAEGLTRHDAIHAVGAVFVAHIYEKVKAKAGPPDEDEAYFAAVEKLTVESWRRGFGPEAYE
jgi:hypothetical protein